MTRIALALVAALAMVSTSQAASLTNKSYTTARKAALAGAAYAFNKAYKGGLYNTRNIKITKAVDTKGSIQKFVVKSANGFRQKTVTVKMDGSHKFRAFLPNRHVFTPGSSNRS